MALIKCIECGNEISDKASSCPHCGCPVEFQKPKNEKNHTISINGVDYNIENVFKLISNNEKIEAIKELRIICGLSLADAKNIVDYMIKTNNVPQNYSLINSQTYGGKSQAIKQSLVKCPYCNATNTKKISTTAKVVNTAMFGIFGNKRKYQWHCNSCNSDF